MTEQVILHKINEAFYKIECSSSVEEELKEYFSFYTDNYRWHPAYKSGAWNGKISMYNRKTINTGLKNSVLEFCQERKYSVSFSEQEPKSLNVTDEEIQRFADKINFIFDPHDFQLKAVRTWINEERSLIVSATSSGKSAMIYLTLRFLLEIGAIRKPLVIVPSKYLVDQMQNDWRDYSVNDDWNVEDEVHGIIGGVEKNSDKSITVSTYQSLKDQPPKYFKEFDAFIIDEGHGAEAKTLRMISDNLTEARWRLGCSGSLKEAKVSRLTLTATIGPITDIIKARELIDRGLASEFEIRMVSFDYSNEDRDLMFHETSIRDIKGKLKPSWPLEVKWLTRHKKRNAALMRLMKKLKGNSCFLFMRMDHAKWLHKKCQELITDMTFYYVDKDTPNEEMTAIIRDCETRNGIVIFSSFKKFSTGINVKNLNNVVLAQSMKASITLLQSIGRTLRKSLNGIDATLWDLYDNLLYKKRSNYSLKHSQVRLRLYMAEKHKIKAHHISLE